MAAMAAGTCGIVAHFFFLEKRMRATHHYIKKQK
jgi:hypothetical protein